MYLSCIILESSCEERLGEEKPTEPKLFRLSFIDPMLHELESFYEVDKPASERFEGGIPVLDYEENTLWKMSGTWLLRIDKNIFSRSTFMTTRPSIALRTFFKELSTTRINLL